MNTATCLAGALAAAHFDEAGFRCLFARLGMFFRSRGCHDPEDRAAQTLLRAMRRLVGGARVENFDAYLFGVAANILREEWRTRRNEALPAELAGAEASFLGLNAREQAVLVDQCLSRVRREDRVLLRAYFFGDRVGLAWECSCSPNALRIRVFRILGAVRKRAANPGDWSGNGLPARHIQ
jgi:DNA-directed RNA polymerase specialized sigma24 family protein